MSLFRVAAGVVNYCGVSRTTMLGATHSLSMAQQTRGKKSRPKVKAVLIEDISGLGYKGEVVDVNAGYLRNKLLPEKQALYGTRDNIEAHAATSSEDAGPRMSSEEVAEKRERDRIESILRSGEIEFKRHSPNKKSFKDSLTPAMVSDQAKKQLKLNIPEDAIEIPGNVQTLGRHKVTVSFEGEQIPVVVNMVRR